ncbi:MAG: hypothetical protein GX442_00595 [Candidatus Riflebacteria bacterium]|nr:hypothetical protein [Candidatus Riflebacteria bacterium]
MNEPVIGAGSGVPMICLTGIDGCGKSTHIRRLADWLRERHGREAAHLHVWDIAKNPRYHTHPFISDQAAVHRYLGLLGPGPRALFVFHGLLESYRLVTAAHPAVVLANGYWYKYGFTEALHGTDAAWLRGVATIFPRPTVTLMLDLDPRAAWARKPAVTPYECGFQAPSEAAFTGFQDRLRGLLLDQGSREGWHLVPVDRPEDEVAADLQQIIEREVISRWT